MSGAASLVKNPAWRTLWVGTTVSTLGTKMSDFAMPLAVYALTSSLTTAGLVSSVSLAGRLALLLPSGVLADRASAKHVATLGGLLQGTFMGILVVLLQMRSGLPWLLASAFGLGASAALTSPALRKLVRLTVDPPSLPLAFSQIEARTQVASIVGPPLAGLMMRAAPLFPLLGDAASFVVQALLVSKLRTRSEPARNMVGFVPALVGGIKAIASSGFLRRICLFAALFNVGGVMLETVALLSFAQREMPSEMLAMLPLVIAVASLVGALLTGKLLARMSGGRLLTVMSGCLILGPSICVIGQSLPAVAVGLCVAFWAVPVINSIIFGYQAAVTPVDMQGKIAAGVQFLAIALGPLGPIAGALLVENVGGGAQFLPGSILLFLAAMSLLTSKHVLSIPKAAEWT